MVCFGVMLPHLNEERLKEVRKKVGGILKRKMSPLKVKCLVFDGSKMGFSADQKLAIMHGYQYFGSRSEVLDLMEKALGISVQSYPDALIVMGERSGHCSAHVKVQLGDGIHSMKIEEKDWKAPHVGTWPIQLLHHVFSTQGLAWANDHFPQQKALRFGGAWREPASATPPAPKPRV